MQEIHLVIAKNLKTLRESKKLSLEKVAELTGVSKTKRPYDPSNLRTSGTKTKLRSRSVSNTSTA